MTKTDKKTGTGSGSTPAPTAPTKTAKARKGASVIVQSKEPFFVKSNPIDADPGAPAEFKVNGYCWIDVKAIDAGAFDDVAAAAKWVYDMGELGKTYRVIRAWDPISVKLVERRVLS